MLLGVKRRLSPAFFGAATTTASQGQSVGENDAAAMNKSASMLLKMPQAAMPGGQDAPLNDSVLVAARGAVRSLQQDLVSAKSELELKTLSLELIAEQMAFVTAERDFLLAQLTATAAAAATTTTATASAPGAPSPLSVSDVLHRIAPDAPASAPLADYLASVNAVQAVIDQHAFDDRGRAVRICMAAPLNTSAVPPPSAECTQPVEQLVQALLRARDAAARLRASPADQRALAAAVAKLDALVKKQPTAAASDHFDALRRALAFGDRLPFEDELGDRLCSMVRCALRVACNANRGWGCFILDDEPAPAAGSDTEAAQQQRQQQEPPAVSAMLHRALWVVGEFEAHGASQSNLMELASAKAFVLAMLAGLERVGRVDARRRHAWEAAQEWAVEAAKLASQPATRVLGQLGDLDALAKACSAPTRSSSGGAAMFRALASRRILPSTTPPIART